MNRTPTTWGKPPQFNIAILELVFMWNFWFLKIMVSVHGLFCLLESSALDLWLGKLTMGWHGNNQQSS